MYLKYSDYDVVQLVEDHQGLKKETRGTILEYRVFPKPSYLIEFMEDGESLGYFEVDEEKLELFWINKTKSFVNEQGESSPKACVEWVARRLG